MKNPVPPSAGFQYHPLPLKPVGVSTLYTACGRSRCTGALLPESRSSSIATGDMKTPRRCATLTLASASVVPPPPHPVTPAAAKPSATHARNNVNLNTRITCFTVEIMRFSGKTELLTPGQRGGSCHRAYYQIAHFLPPFLPTQFARHDFELRAPCHRRFRASLPPPATASPPTPSPVPARSKPPRWRSRCLAPPGSAERTKTRWRLWAATRQ